MVSYWGSNVSQGYYNIKINHCLLLQSYLNGCFSRLFTGIFFGRKSLTIPTFRSIRRTRCWNTGLDRDCRGIIPWRLRISEMLTITIAWCRTAVPSRVESLASPGLESIIIRYVQPIILWNCALVYFFPLFFLEPKDFREISAVTRLVQTRLKGNALLE